MNRNTRMLFQSLTITSAMVASVSTHAAALGKVTKLELNPAKERAIFVLSYDGNNPKFRMIQSERQGSVIIEAEGLELPARLTRVVDASKNAGPVMQITPYAANDEKRTISKFVLQLRGPAEVVTSELPGKFMVELRRKKADVTTAAAATPVKASAKPFVRPSWSETDTVANTDSANAKSEDTARRLVEVLNAPPEEKNYFGTRVTFEGNSVDVHDLFRLVGEASGLNIITDADVKGASNYTLKEVPWDQVLDLAVQQNNLKAKVSGNVVRLVTLEKFTKEQEDKLKEISLADEMEPVVMAVVPLSYADATKMKATVENLLINRGTAASASSNGQGGAPALPTRGGATASVPAQAAAAEQKFRQDFVRGKIEVDARSNSLVITNTRDSIERIRRLVKELDVALPQVLIDTKVVIAHDGFSKQVGVSWGGGATSSGSGRAGAGIGFNGGQFNSDSPNTTITAPGSDTTSGSGSTSTSGGSSASGSSSAGSTGAGTTSQFTLSSAASKFLGGFRLGAGQHGNLTAALNLSEANDLSKTIASPRVIVNNNQEATVSDGQTINVPTAAGVGSSGSLATINAALTLKVKPQVTSSGAVLLDVDIKKSQPNTSAAGTITTSDKSIKTNVLVDSGSTLVLGGVYQFASTRADAGIPVLKDLPFIGQLFRTNTDSDTKDELMVFLTPQILDTNSSTLGAGAEPVGSM
jgi:type IV pilus assembly protein PilQ